MRSAYVCGFLLCVFLVGDRVDAEEFKSDSGYSLEVPAKWKAATPKQMKKILDDAMRQTGRKMSVDETIWGPSSARYTPRVSISVHETRMPNNADTEESIIKQEKKSVARLGVSADDVKVTHRTIDGESRLTIAYEQNEGVRQVRVWTLYVIGKTKRYSVTVRCLKSQWKECMPAVSTMFDSFKLSADEK